MVEGMAPTDERKLYTLLDPGMELTPTQEHEEELEYSRFLAGETQGSSCFGHDDVNSILQRLHT